MPSLSPYLLFFSSPPAACGAARPRDEPRASPCRSAQTVAIFRANQTPLNSPKSVGASFQSRWLHASNSGTPPKLLCTSRAWVLSLLILTLSIFPCIVTIGVPEQVVIERADEPLETRNRGAVSIARCRQTFKHGQPHPFSSVLVMSVLLCRGNRAPSTATLQPTPTPSQPPSNLNSAKGYTSLPYKHAKRLSSHTHFTPDNIPTRG